MELVKINAEGLECIYALSIVEKEFCKAVNETWKESPPLPRYQKKLLQSLAILDQQKERAIDLMNFEKLSGESSVYSIRYPNAQKNIRVLYTIEEGYIILLTAFLEKNDSDYQRAIKTAKRRKRMLEKD